MQRISVMIVEDDPFWQLRLSEDLSLEHDIEVIGVSSYREDALSFLRNNIVNVILMDINLTENRLDGLDTARDIFRLHPTSPRPSIIMLTSLDDDEVIVRSFESGAINYLSKSSYRDIVTAIRNAYHGKNTIHSDAAAAIVKEMQIGVLTPSEKEVYRLKKKGFTKTQISEQLHKSVNTIRTQLKSIKKKLLDHE
ncbi:MAG: response regulator [Clostridia bacterium]